jgi:hypothetical protein
VRQDARIEMGAFVAMKYFEKRAAPRARLLKLLLRSAQLCLEVGRTLPPIDGFRVCHALATAEVDTLRACG